MITARNPNSYFAGLTPTEFHFHATFTGYIQRRLIKAMESVMVNYDGTVRNSVDQLIKLRNSDGLCGVAESVYDQAADSASRFDPNNVRNFRRVSNQDVIKKLMKSPNVIQKIETEYKQLLRDRKVETHLPEWWNTQKIFHKNKRDKTDFFPFKVIGVRELLNNRFILTGTNRL
ncbi:DNA-directed RNA polymerase II subunit RPB1-like [Armigeres subalbatus]|uniref:DNA-directed RNA polymerase II subunit RPB1-like n=1 Tax=Armigeres subalbatus TaxID=124917 RepID=UPI002ED3B0C3